MRWSFRLGKVAGTEVRVHVTFFILLAVFGWVYYGQGGAAAAIDGVLFILAVFTCVLLHEFGHVLMAKKFGVRTPDVTLLPIGGLARLERMPEKPIQEILVAIAGPAVNVAIVLILVPFYWYLPASEDQAELIFDLSFGTRLLWINIGLVLFNMIPAFPMDGGRVLRALLAMVMPYGKATEVAATIGQMFAVVGGVVGLYHNPILVLIAVFIFLAARAEAQMVKARIALEGVPLQRAMMTDFHVLRRGDTLNDAAVALLAGAQHDFPVVDSAGQLEGLLTRSRLIEAITKRGPSERVEEVMLTDVPTVPLHYPLREAFLLLRMSPMESLPVVAEGERRVLGLLTAENVGELMLLREAAGTV